MLSQPAAHFIKKVSLTFLYRELVVVHFVDPASVLHVQVVLSAHSHPCAARTPTVFQDVFAIVDELDFCVLL
ncbi:hypothetical protein FGO68_gene10307 [Halteria grandinella]|uniref:Uncharacterized protein n=1 Tax=Halteria grandinella TaxID=5974 RepID=A0A8J8NUZ1_HALGN|nr:hypothetical protein FGO68_gene10307 [Halteria grandinella]